jgi:uncharacterized DUF497 family protein
MKLTWDEVKRQATLKERGLDFANCAQVFAGETHNFEDRRKRITASPASSAWFFCMGG